MYKIAISGPASSGKNTTANIIKKYLQLKFIKDGILSGTEGTNDWYKCTAFADPIKQIAKTMYPQIPTNYLFGSSKFRKEIIPYAFKNNSPLSIRQLLIDIGSSGQVYNQNIWVDVFDSELKLAEKKLITLMVVPDLRFRHEFDYLKKEKFFTIRINRKTDQNINHISEQGHLFIQDQEFDAVVDNNDTLQNFTLKIKEIMELYYNSTI